MPDNPKPYPYKLLAQYYDKLFSFAVSWGANARQHVLGDLLPSFHSVCDIACGSGTAAVEWARLGLDVYAVDLSPGMCGLARRKARRAGVSLTVIRSDMRKFRLPTPVDLITCEFDALNHIPRKADLAAVAASVARALNPGGWFYFDVNNRLAFEKIWPLTWYMEKPGVVLVMRGGYWQPEGRAFADAEWFIREGRLWRRFHEHVEEVCWTPAEIRAALREAGFGRIRAYDAGPFFTDDRFYRPGYRTFYLARKVRG